jgi:hypothetical protein
MGKVDDGGQAIAVEPVGTLPGQTVCFVAYVDDNGGLLACEYPAEPLTAELAAAIMANLIRDTLDDGSGTPNLQAAVVMQKTLMAALSGGDSPSTK